MDDTPTNLELLEAVLRAGGFWTVSAADGRSARALGKLEQPDLILLDVMMPGESGFETCSTLGSDPATSNIPIIFLSALDDVKSKVTGLKIGGVDYISKPVHGEEVLARVRVHPGSMKTTVRSCRSIGRVWKACARPSRPSWCGRITQPLATLAQTRMTAL